jgi:uncharacterized protein HemX
MTNKTPIIIAILIIMAGLGAGGYYVMKSRESTNVATSDTSATPTSQASPTISASNNDISIETELNETNVTEDDADLKALENDINQL